MKKFKFWLLFHVLGIGSLWTSIFVHAFVFYNIVLHGSFLGEEGNQLVLSLEVSQTVFAIIYLAYLTYRFRNLGLTNEVKL